MAMALVPLAPALPPMAVAVCAGRSRGSGRTVCIRREVGRADTQARNARLQIGEARAEAREARVKRGEGCTDAVIGAAADRVARRGEQAAAIQHGAATESRDEPLVHRGETGAAVADAALQSVKLAAVDRLGAGGRNRAGSDIDDPARDAAARADRHRVGAVGDGALAERNRAARRRLRAEADGG